MASMVQHSWGTTTNRKSREVNWGSVHGRLLSLYDFTCARVPCTRPACSHRRERSEAVDRVVHALPARVDIQQDRCCVFPQTRPFVPRQVPEKGSCSSRCVLLPADKSATVSSALFLTNPCVML